MAARHQHPETDGQLDLFASPRPTHETIDPIRPNGRDTLAGALPEDGARTGAQGPPPPDAAGGRGQDEGGDGDAPGPADEAGSDTTASPRSGLGNGAGEVHPAAARRVTPIRPDPPKNLNS